MSEKIRDYIIIDQIASGGMGKIFKAIHPALKNHVIIKQLEKKSNKEFKERFEREAKIMMSLRHENIVPVYDYFIENNQRYIVMEYIDGITLSELITTKGKIDPLAAIFIYNEVCKGLHYAHQKDVVHRDLKPSNIMISNNGEVKIIDFGIASSPEKTTNLTETGLVIGTPAYMSPEQLSDLKQVTHKSDIYSMGVILYEMLCGKTPFGSYFSAESISLRLSGKFQNAKKIESNIPIVINKIIKKSLNPKPDKRYKNISKPMSLLKPFTKLSQIEICNNLREYINYGKYTEEIKKTKPLYSSFFNSLRKSMKRKLAFLSIFLILVLSALYYWGREKLFLKLNEDKLGSFILKYNFPMPRFGSLPDKNRFPEHYKIHFERRKTIIVNHIDIYTNFLLKATLFQSDENRNIKNKISEIKLNQKNYNINSDNYLWNSEPERFLILKSENQYQKKGYYAIKIELNNQVYWEFFYLDVMKKQNSSLLINVNYNSNQRRLVWFNFSFTDEQTGDLIHNVKIEVLWNNRWILWNEFVSKKENIEKMFNGNFYFFKFSHPDYVTARFLRVNTELNEVQVNINERLKQKNNNIASN